MVIRLLDRQISVLLLDIWEGALAKSDKIDRVVPNREVGDKIGRLKLKISRRRWHPSGILQCKSICDLLGKVCFVLVSEQLLCAKLQSLYLRKLPRNRNLINLTTLLTRSSSCVDSFNTEAHPSIQRSCVTFQAV